jgi:hypothetical protein
LQGDFQEFLGLIHERYRGWQVSLLLDGDSSHIAKRSRRLARLLEIALVWLPVCHTQPGYPPDTQPGYPPDVKLGFVAAN